MRRFFQPFVLIVTLILTLGYIYLGLRLAVSRADWIALALPFFSVWILPAFYWSSERENTTLLLTLMQWSGFLSMGFLSFVFLFSLARDIVLGAFLLAGVHFFKPAFTPRGNGILLLLAFGALLLGMLRALTRPRVKKVRIPIRDLDPALDGLKIAQISDLHVGPTLRHSFVASVVNDLNSLNPDLVALTGDFADGSVSDLKHEISPLALLAPKGRIFYVPGNHEYYWDGSGWIREMQSLGATPLLNAGISFEFRGARLFVAGVLDPAASLEEAGRGPDVLAASRGSEGAKLRILLAHQPKIAPLASKAGFDLQLSGHTHGGQFWPWTWVARRVHRGLLQGLTRVNQMWVYVSPGTGTWGPPVRLGTSTEITLLQLFRLEQ